MDPRIKLALQLMGEIATGRLTVARVAQEVGLSPSRFEHILKKTTGKSFRQHIHRIRIREAKRLLKDWHLSLKQIAYMTGYASPASFTRAFRSTVRRSPSQYRLTERSAQRKSIEVTVTSRSGK
jgi:AraC-like DNA-binding protein